MSATDAGLREAVAVLNGPAKAIRDAVLSGHSVPWLGSGISRERFPGLDALLFQLLGRLHDRSTPSDPACPFLAVIRQILDLVPDHGLDPTAPPAAWDANKRDHALKLLVGKYSAILDFQVRTATGVLAVRWDILDIVSLYSDPNVLPDSEHVLTAILMAEGVWTHAVTTNWDCLVEAADELMSDGMRPAIQTIACNDELPLGTDLAASRLFKIHGCAKKAANDPARYRPFMVATDFEIGRWTESDDSRPFRESLRHMLRERPVVFIGLSGQDFNLKVQFIAAWLRSSFDADVPKVSFSTASLTTDHRTILRGFYGDDEFSNNEPAITASSVIPLYGKPLLGGLYFELLFAKANVILGRSNDLRADSLRLARDGLAYLRQMLITYWESRLTAVGPSNMWRELADLVPRSVARCVTLFRYQTKCRTGASYSAVGATNCSALNTDPNLPPLRFQWLLWAIALLVQGMRNGLWSVSFDTTVAPTTPTMIIHIGPRKRPVALVGDYINGCVRCEDNGILDPVADPESLVIYPADRRPAAAARTPARALRIRGTSAQLKELWLGDLYADSINDDEVLEYLQVELT